jgi:hypothetical protein
VAVVSILFAGLEIMPHTSRIISWQAHQRKRSIRVFCKSSPGAPNKCSKEEFLPSVGLARDRSGIAENMGDLFTMPRIGIRRNGRVRPDAEIAVSPGRNAVHGTPFCRIGARTCEVCVYHGLD